MAYRAINTFHLYPWKQCIPVVLHVSLLTRCVHLRQVLKVGCPDMITLDCGKITGRGITMGSSFQVGLWPPGLYGAGLQTRAWPPTSVQLPEPGHRKERRGCNAAPPSASVARGQLHGAEPRRKAFFPPEY